MTAEEAKVLNMASDAVDDMYDGCREAALAKLIDSGLLQEELTKNKEFQDAWQSVQCSKQIPGGIKVHTAALSAYVSGDDSGLRQALNLAVETMGVNVSTYQNNFHFKSLHFLLMDSITLLNPKECKTVYLLREVYTAVKGSEVRLGQFAFGHFSFEELEEMQDLDDQVVFNITSCFFANLKENGCSTEDTAVLSPAEVFTVEEVKNKTDSNEASYTEIRLKHSKLESLHNCYIVSRWVFSWLKKRKTLHNPMNILQELGMWTLSKLCGIF